jgi:hypothetical protein
LLSSNGAISSLNAGPCPRSPANEPQP